MAINFAEKYLTQIDERFKQASLTGAAVNNNFDWIGVKTVNVYSIPTTAMNDYERSGDKRYGNPEELQNQLQELPISQDRSFTFTIDRGNYNETMMTLAAGQALARQIDEAVVPEIDIYRLAKFVANAGKTAVAPITKTNAYESFLDASLALTDKKVPLEGRIAFVSPNFYKCIKLDEAFIKKGDMSQEMLIKGTVGMIDNTRLILAPSTYLVPNVEFVVTHPSANPSPIKLSEYKTHDNPQGISGWLVEGRIIYDCFTLNNKKDATYVHKAA